MLVYSSSDYISLLRVEGVDVAKFLQGQITNDIKKVSPKRAIIAAFCSNKGKVLSIFRIYQEQKNSYLLECSKDMCDAIINRLSLFTINQNVKVKECVDKKILTIRAERSNITGFPKNYLESVIWQNVMVIKISQTQNRYNIITPKENINKFLDNNIRNFTRADENSHLLDDIKDSFVRITDKITDKFVPQSLGLGEIDALDFKKGCYIGQEVVARIKYLGKVKRTLHKRTIKADKETKVGDVIFATDKKTNKTTKIGEVITLSLDKDKKNYKMLCVLNKELMKEYGIK
jgi:tRNA-modifying protein YgfZ